MRAPENGSAFVAEVAGEGGKALRVRNIAIIAHVDHGKTTLIDRLLQQCGALGRGAADVERALDTNDLERERGITILSKSTAIEWCEWRINIVDTPGHADFGGEVERVLSMVDSVLLLVDAVEGPMPQTRFVTEKALVQGLAPIVAINKIDRDGARPAWVLDRTFDLFDRLGASERQLDFPVVYTSALHGYANATDSGPVRDMTPLLEVIVAHTPAPEVDPDGSLQMQISTLDYSPYVGPIGIGRIQRGRVRANSPVLVVEGDGAHRNARVLEVMRAQGLERRKVDEAWAGEIVAVSGIDALRVSDTLCDPAKAEALPPLRVDEPTVRMTFGVNTSPFAGRDGRFVTGRHLRDRLQRELIHNVALRVEETEDPDRLLVCGRGELHLSILIENMRREGYELAVASPEVINKVVDGRECEPFEQLSVDVEDGHLGAVMEMLGSRRGVLDGVQASGQGRTRVDYVIPSRALIGLRTEYLSATSGSGLMHHTFSHYAPRVGAAIPRRRNGALVANASGKALAYALFNLQERGRLLIGPGVAVYEGMVVGIHSRSNDLVVNPMKAKQLTNIRAAGSDENILLTPPLELTLESAMSLINRDELVEITPGAIRIRKVQLHEHERRRAARAASAGKRASA